LLGEDAALTATAKMNCDERLYKMMSGYLLLFSVLPGGVAN